MESAKIPGKIIGFMLTLPRKIKSALGGVGSVLSAGELFDEQGTAPGPSGGIHAIQKHHRYCCWRSYSSVGSYMQLVVSECERYIE